METLVTPRSHTIRNEETNRVSKTYQEIGISFLDFACEYSPENVADYLVEAFKDIEIGNLSMDFNHMSRESILHLRDVFKGSQIATLSLAGQKLLEGIKHLVEFLKEVKVLELTLDGCYIGDEGMEHLAPVLKDNVMRINLAWNNIGADGARYLAQVLKDSKILYIDLCNNHIGVDGARYLAEGLPHSQVTSIHLHGNSIEFAGYQYLIDVVNDTNLSWVNFHMNNIEKGFKEGDILSLNSIPRNITSIAVELCHVFEELVSLNSKNNEFEFIVPTKNTSPTLIDKYVFLIKTLNGNNNCKAHIIHMLCYERNSFDFDMMNKVNHFISILSIKFNAFIDSKLPELVETFDGYNYVNLVKEFENIKMHDIVQNLLMHRLLYYVDEKQEILHPYIYKMLHKYSLPLFNTWLEPNKKTDIISFYQSHQGMDGAQEIIDLLQSESFD